MCVLMVYINGVYISDMFDIYGDNPPNYITHPQSLLAFGLLICLIWPTGYEFVRMHKEGLKEYFMNLDNYT